jgi:hypothetical protein
MHIQGISATISKETLGRFLKGTKFPEGVTLVDTVLADRTVILVLRMTSYFGIPVRVRLELDSFEGSRIIFKATPPMKSPVTDVLEISQPNGPEATSHNRYTLAEMDLVKLSKGIINAATIKDLSISRNGVFLQVEGIQTDPHRLLAPFQSLSTNHK